jgi:DNA invertase Pin-like site-specific DNA recombinase
VPASARSATNGGHDDRARPPELTILAGLAEFERELIRARTGEGRRRALAAGVKFGRKPKLAAAHQKREAIRRRDKGDETLIDIARSHNISHSTISRLA